MIKISIIIPVYNVELYIKECLNSVMSQTYQGKMECLIVDDCGTDRSIKLAEQIIESYKGSIEFHILHHKHNRGLSAARNTGMNAATGDYLYFLDSDDSIIPQCLELMAEMQNKYPQADVIQAGALCDYDFLNIETKNLPEYTDDREWIKKTFLQRFIIPMTSWNKLIKRQFIESHGLTFREGLIHEDELFNFYLAKHVQSIAFVKKNTYCYRTLRTDGIMQQCSNNDGKSDRAWLSIAKECIGQMDDFCKEEQYLFIVRVLYERYFTMWKPTLKKNIRMLILKLIPKVSHKYAIVLLTMLLPYSRVLNFIEHRRWIYKRCLGL